jgi:hypothetical protein
LNGVKQQVSVDFVATNGTSVVFGTGLTSGDIVDIVAYGAFDIANVLLLSGGTMTGAITFAGAQTWPTFNQNTTGTAAGLSTTLVPGSGGTGLTSPGTAGNLLTSDGAGNWTSTAPAPSVSRAQITTISLVYGF